MALAARGSPGLTSERIEIGARTDNQRARSPLAGDTAATRTKEDEGPRHGCGSVALLCSGRGCPVDGRGHRLAQLPLFTFPTRPPAERLHQRQRPGAGGTPRPHRRRREHEGPDVLSLELRRRQLRGVGRRVGRERRVPVHGVPWRGRDQARLVQPILVLGRRCVLFLFAAISCSHD